MLLKRVTYAFMFLLLTAGCKKPKALQYLDFQNLDLESFGIGQSVISADVRFFNPNNYNLKFKEADVAVSVNDTYLGNSKLDSLIIIPRNDTFSIPVKLSVDMKKLIANSLLSLLSKEVDIKMEGTARVGKGSLFVNFPFSYQGKQKLDFLK